MSSSNLTLDVVCPRCLYDLRAQAEARAERCSECGLLLPEIAADPAETYLARYAHCLEALRLRLEVGWHEEHVPLKNQCVPLSRNATFHQILLLAFLLILILSGLKPKDQFTWFLEVAPAIIGAIVLVVTYRRFRLTDLTYVLIFLHACILCVGGHYTYAEVPLGNWVRDALNLSRNHYDRLGHFAQGFVPAIIARELLLRCSPLQRGKWLAFIVISICLAISAAYELVEWTVAALTGEAAEAFLGTQGDPWDTQKDMTLALIGACCALLMLGRAHNKALARLLSPCPDTPQFNQ